MEMKRLLFIFIILLRKDFWGMRKMWLWGVKTKLSGKFTLMDHVVMEDLLKSVYFQARANSA
jgi:hypothetical protein